VIPNNTAIGFQALHVSQNDYNSALGCQALTLLTTGYLNTALGTYSMYYTKEGVNNTVVGFISAENISSGTDNICLGSAAGIATSLGTGNVCIGSNCNVYLGDCIGSIVLGSRVNSSSPNVVNTANNQLYIAPSITSFNISGLTPSRGRREGTILEFDSSGNITPSAGTYNMVSKIDTGLSSLQSSVTTNTSDITTLLSGGTVFTTTGSYSVPLNVTTITIEAMRGGGGGSSGGTGSDGAWAGEGGGGSGALESITIPVTSRQVIDFTIGVGGAGGAQPTQSRGNGTSTTRTMYGQTLLTANGIYCY